MKKILGIAFMLLLITVYRPDPVHAQSILSAPILGVEDISVKSVAGDFLHILTAPFRLSKQNGVKLAAFSAASAGLVLFLDEPIEENFSRRPSRFPYDVLHNLAEVGDVYDSAPPSRFVLAACSGMLAGGFIARDKKLVKTSMLAAEAIFFTTTVTFAAKNLFGRSRPYTGLGATDFNLFLFNNVRAQKSIPSGHASTIFALSTVVAKQYSQWWVKFPVYGFAVTVALQRLESRSHWASDVLTGGTLGYLIGSAVVRRHSRGRTRGRAAWRIFPGGAGLTIRF